MGFISWLESWDDRRLVDRKRHGPFVGTWEVGNAKTFTPLHYELDGHVFLAAPSRSGKGRDVLIPSLLTNNDSAVIIDVKGELAAVTARARREMGHEVLFLNPFGEPSGVGDHWPRHGFNPLAAIKRSSPNLIGDIESIASALIVNDGKGEPHWADGARSLVAGLMLHEVLSRNGEKTRPQLARVRGYVSMSDSDFQSCIQSMVKHPHPVVRDRLAMFTNMTNELRAFRSSAKTQTTWLSDPVMHEVTSLHDFDFAELKKKPMTVYVILPSRHVASGSTYSRYLRLIVQSALDAMTRTPRQSARPVWFCIDEFYSLGHMAMLERMSSEGAGFGIQLYCVVQNLGQLKELYPANWETFIANSAVRQFFAPADFTTASYLSKMLGQTTVNTKSINPKGEISVGETGQPLMRPEEVMALPNWAQIVLMRGARRPFLLGREPYFADAWGLHGRFDANPYFVG